MTASPVSLAQPPWPVIFRNGMMGEDTRATIASRLRLDHVFALNHAFRVMSLDGDGPISKLAARHVAHVK